MSVSTSDRAAKTKTDVVLLDPATPERLARIRPFLPEGWHLRSAASRGAGDQIAALRGAQFAINRNLVRGHTGIHGGKWLKGELGASSMKLSGRTVGIVGMGYIGKALARLLRGFDCRIVYTKRTPLSAAEEAETGISYAPLETLLAAADVVTLNCELNDSTRNMINRDRLALMKPDAILVNAARGGVLVEAPAVLEEASARQARANRNRGRVAAGEKLGDLSGATRMVEADRGLR